MNKIIGFIVFFLFASNCFGLDGSAILLGASNQVFWLNIGEVDGVKANDFALINRNRGTLERPKIEKLARVKCLKVEEKASLWREIDGGGAALKKGESYFIIPSSVVKESLAPRTYQQVYHLGFQKDFDKEKYEFEKKEGIPQKLLLGNNYFAESVIGEQKNFDQKDLVSHKLAYWESRGSDHRWRVPAESTQMEQEVKTLTSATIEERQDQYEKGLNRLQGGVDDLYARQERDQDAGDLKKEGALQSEFDEFILDRETPVQQSAKRKLQREGELWSRNFSDSGLRKFLVQSGIEEERRRQRGALAERKNHEFSLVFTRAMTDQTDATDNENRGFDAELGIAYEMYLSQISEGLDRFSLELSYKSGSAYFDAGTEEFIVNVSSSTQIFRLGLFYYLNESMFHSDSLRWFAGVHFGFGTSTISSERLSREYSYNTTIFPGFSAGVKLPVWSSAGKKYEFDMGASFNGRISYESQSYSTDEDILNSDTIAGEISRNVFKVELGLSLLF